ncbi:MAG: hypothetical protein C0P77_012875 [Thermoanaerobacterales bacterium]|nr:hypothetical protein [Thermoanaerobacterales bacterium]
MSRIRRSILLALLALVATACEVRTRVTVDVAEDGSGTVEVAVGLDRAALEELPDLDGDGARTAADLDQLVRDDDLVAAGWIVEPAATDGDGTTWVRARRAFGTPEEAERVLAELTGPDGPLRDVRLVRSESFGRDRFELSGTVDLRDGLEAFGDEAMAAVLEGEPLGEDPAVIEERLGRPLAEVFTFELVAALPGGTTTWSPRLGDGPVEVRAETTVHDWPVLGLAALAVASFLALVVVLVVRAVRRRPA